MRNAWGRIAVPAVLVGIGIVIGLGWSQWAGRLFPAASAADQAASSVSEAKIQRFGSVIGVKPEKLDEYVRLHAAAWPGVLDGLRKVNVRNYSIYLGQLDDGKLYLFSYFEYTGEDFDGDMKKMAADPITQKWWKLTDPCQIPQKDRKPGENWMAMKEVFHMD